MCDATKQNIVPKRQHLNFDIKHVCDSFLSSEKLTFSISDHFVKKVVARNIPIHDISNKFEKLLEEHFETIKMRLKYSRLGTDIRVVSKKQVLVLEAKYINDDHIEFCFITMYEDCGGLTVLLTGNEYYV